MKRERGQGLVEYLVLVCLVAVSAIAITKVVGANIKEQFLKVSHALAGKKEKVQFTRPSKADYQKRGMDDYDEGAAD